MIHQAIHALVRYGLERGLLEQADRIWAVNTLLDIMGLDADEEGPQADLPLEDILNILVDDAAARGLCTDDVTGRDLFDARLMGAITPRPSQVRREFARQYEQGPEQATSWFYTFCRDTDYIRTSRIRKDVKWKTVTEYGELDITINLSKPEKDPRAIAAARTAPQVGYPKCQLCLENEGYAGRLNHPARQNHRVIPVTLEGKTWYFQYSPYVYYNEHCIVLGEEHAPMKIDRSTFRRQMDFIRQFPHYFVGSNADLPIVGGSILSHDHFQGGRYTFPMERAPVEQEVMFAGFDDVSAGIVKWPMSVLRLRCADDERLVELADRILQVWRGYTDEQAMILAETDGVPHNTITPIARMRDGAYELDLVLRNNLTTDEYPLGLYHPHPELHHIKKENIGLIEVMGLAVLPARLKQELADLARVLAAGEDPGTVPELEKHAQWAWELVKQYDFTEENADQILRDEVGKVFAAVLEHAGVYKRTEAGRQAFLRFVRQV